MATTKRITILDRVPDPANAPEPPKVEEAKEEKPAKQPSLPGVK